MTPTAKQRVPVLRVLLLVSLGFALGCSKSGKVTGTVKYDGKVVPLGTVTFIPEKGKAVSVQIKDGQYSADKVPPGPAKVKVDTSGIRQELDGLKRAGGDLPGIPGGKLPGGKEDPRKELNVDKERLAELEKMVDVPASYNDENKSGLSLTVESGSQDFNIDLAKRAK